MDKEIRTLLDALQEIVNHSSPYQDKRDAVIEACLENDRTNLNEFVSWFGGELVDEDEDEDGDED